MRGILYLNPIAVKIFFTKGFGVFESRVAIDLAT